MAPLIEHPFTAAKVRTLKVGDRVRVSGPLYTARDRIHRYLQDGNELPVDLKDAAIYHCGPVVRRKEDGWAVIAAGPTTSARQDPYTPDLIRRCHVRVIIGKGGMGESTRKACAEHGCVYLQAVGGAAALLAQSITGVTGVHFLREFGPSEAMWELLVSDFPAVVAIDARGRSLHRRIRQSSSRALKNVVNDPPLA